MSERQPSSPRAVDDEKIFRPLKPIQLTIVAVSSGGEASTAVITGWPQRAGNPAMKACSREAALRSKQFEVTQKAHKVATMETMIADFERRANDLMRQITDEQERTGIKNPEDFAYSTFAKAARLRRDNLLKSTEDLKAALYAARREHQSATIELGRLDAGPAGDAARAAPGREGSTRIAIAPNPLEEALPQAAGAAIGAVIEGAPS